jgi:hypothetical protein
MSRFHYEVVASESEFEELVCDLHNALHKTNTFQLYKGRGSNQYGIDIFSREEGIVIQCKKKDPSRKDKELRAELAVQIRECVTKAHGLPFDFKTFILATTTKKYGDVQDIAIGLSKEFPFCVQLMAWADLEKHLHYYPDIRGKYYPHLSTEKSRAQEKPPVSQPITGTIGANALLKHSIIERFNKLGEEREKRHGKSAYSVMYKKFKTDFKIKKQQWTCIWEWPEVTAPAIRNYLNAKYANTISGRIEARRSRDDYVPSRPQLIAKEKEALSYLGLNMSSPEVKELLSRLFGVTSHTNLSHLQYWHFVLYLESKVRTQLGER